MAAGVITISGIKYAAGLYWQPSPDAKVAAAARATAKQAGYQADFYCVRPPTKAQPVGQFGLGLASAGHKSGMPVAAACLAYQQPGSWTGGFRVPEGIWFITVRDDLVDPDGDMLFADEAEAQAHVEQEIARGGLVRIFCPPEWGVPGSESTSLPSLLTGRKDVTLTAVRANPKTLALIFGILVLLGLIYAGYSWWQGEQEKKRVEEERQRQEEMARNKVILKTEYPRTWEKSPKPMDYLSACGAAFQKTPATVQGWQISSLECAADSFTINWTRTVNVPGVIPTGKSTLNASLTTAVNGLPLEGLHERGAAAEKLNYYGDNDRLLLNYNWPVQLQLLPDDVIQAAEGQPAPPPPEWRKRSTVFNLSSAPWLRPDIFDTLPGLVLTKVKQSGTTYTIEGTLYENRNAR